MYLLKLYHSNYYFSK